MMGKGHGNIPKMQGSTGVGQVSKKKVKINQGFNSILTLNITKYLTLARDPPC
jgi:hypothetical protein